MKSVIPGGEDGGAKSVRPQKRKLTFGEKRERDALMLEMEELPQRIESLEKRQGELHAQLSDPELYKGDGSRAAGLTAELEGLERDLEAAFERWSEAGERLQELTAD